MRGTDFVVMVTEPTPFGLHDLKLAFEAVKILGIPCGLVINRADLGDDRIRDYAREEGVPILMEIPFDRRIAEAYSRGELIVEALPEYGGLFRELLAAQGEPVSSLRDLFNLWVDACEDVFADFSTNEPIIDGTVSLLLLLKVWDAEP